MGGDVDGGDRHQRVHEARAPACARRSRRRRCARRPSRAGRSRPRARRPSSRPIVSVSVEPERVEQARSRCRVQIAPWLSPSNVTVPIITTTNGDRARRALERRQAAEQRAHADLAAALLEDRQAREEVEVDREGLAAARPGLDAVERHPGPGDDAVDERPRWPAAPGARPSPRRSSIQVKMSRPTAAGHRPSFSGYWAPPAQADGAGGGAPRVQRVEDVAEQHAGERHPDPEDDQDEDRREVRQRRRTARRSRRRSSTTSSRKPIAPRRPRAPASRARGRCPRAAGASGRARAAARDHSTASAANETTRTTAAAQQNSHSGSGRLARWTSPWASSPVNAPTSAADREEDLDALAAAERHLRAREVPAA